MREILLFLASFHCHPNPELAYSPGLIHPSYVGYHAVQYANLEDSAVLVHDLYTACFHPKSLQDWYIIEEEASKIAEIWRKIERRKNAR